jgi:hypothetical protein
LLHLQWFRCRVSLLKERDLWYVLVAINISLRWSENDLLRTDIGKAIARQHDGDVICASASQREIDESLASYRG